MVAFAAPSLVGEEAVGEGAAISVALGLMVGLGVAVSSGEGEGLGLGVGEVFSRFNFAAGVSLGEGVPDVFLCLGDDVGDGLGVECFRCFRAGVGVGVA